MLSEIDRHIWIGGSDLAIEGTWIWTTSRRLIDTFFWSDAYGGQPNHGLNQHCIAMSVQGHIGLWNDANCNNLYVSVCEFYF